MMVNSQHTILELLLWYEQTVSKLYKTSEYIEFHLFSASRKNCSKWAIAYTCNS